MYYNNIYFHNVNLMEKDEDGNYLLCRFDEDVLFENYPKKSKKEAKTNDDIIYISNDALKNNASSNNSGKTKETPQTQEFKLDSFKAFNALSLGVELRFKLVSDTVKIKLKLLDGQDPALVEVYFGNYFAGKNYTKIICDNSVLEYTFDSTLLPAPNKKESLGFANNIIRIILPTRNVLFVGVEGQTEIPQVYEMPTKNLIFLGSNGFGASETDRPSLSIAFEVASKLNANSYVLTTPNLDEDLIKALMPYILRFKKSSVLISDVLSSEINLENHKSQLKFLKRKVKRLSKFKNRVLFVDYLFNHFNFQKEKLVLKMKAKIEKILSKKPYVSPYENYDNSMLLGVNDLSTFAISKTAVDIVEVLSENYEIFIKKQKIGHKFIHYSITTLNDEPTDEPIIMTKEEKRQYLNERKLKLKESKLKEKENRLKEKENSLKEKEAKAKLKESKPQLKENKAKLDEQKTK